MMVDPGNKVTLSPREINTRGLGNSPVIAWCQRFVARSDGSNIQIYVCSHSNLVVCGLEIRFKRRAKL